MVLEAVMFCVDNSCWMRNGDYAPSRLDAQNEAVNVLASMKTQSNPETCVGLMSMAGKRIDVLLSLQRDLGKIMNRLHKLKPLGQSNFEAALKTAQLVLKNRSNKNQKQRIIMFVGSPVLGDKKTLIRVGKNMKKNNVAVDVINFGYENSKNQNVELLEGFVNAVKSGDNCKFVNISPNPLMNLSDSVLSSIAGDQSQSSALGSTGVSSAIGGDADMMSVDASIDPELAMALRMSMEEERLRQENEAARTKKGQEESSSTKSESNSTQNVVATSSGSSTESQQSIGVGKDLDVNMKTSSIEESENDEGVEEEALLAQAIALSMAAELEDSVQDIEMLDSSQDQITSTSSASNSSLLKEAYGKLNEDLIPKDKGDSKLQDDNNKTSKEASNAHKKQVYEALQDQDFIEDLIDSLQGVDKNEIDIQEVIQEVRESQKQFTDEKESSDVSKQEDMKNTEKNNSKEHEKNEKEKEK